MISIFELGEIISYGGYYGRFDIMSKDKNKFVPFGRDFQIIRIVQQVETEEFFIKFATQFGDKVITKEIPRSELDARGIEKLNAVGFDIRTAEPSIFQAKVAADEEEYLSRNKKIYICHFFVGWEDVKNKDIHGLKAPDGIAYKSYNHIGNVESEYRGVWDIKPRGISDGQTDFIKEEVTGFIPCEVMVMVGLSAVVQGMLKTHVHTTNPIVHLVNDSSSGKTTAAMLAVSVAGVPDIHSTSLFMSCNATYNALITRMVGNTGMPVAMDELSKYKGDFSSAVYALSDGRDKDRLNRNAELKKTDKNHTFATTIISTGECSLLDRCNNNTGLKARVIELNASFTKDAAHANRIKDGCYRNCGYLAPKLAMYATKKGIDYVVGLHRKWSEQVSARIPDNPIRDRIGAQIAIIMTAGELANAALKLDFDLKKALDFILEASGDKLKSTDMATEAYYKFTDYAKSNPNHFTRFFHRNGEVTPCCVTGCEIWGRIDSGLNKPDDRGTVVGEISFTEQGFAHISKVLGYEDYKLLIKQLKNGGFLNCEKSKTYRKRKLSQRDNSMTKLFVLKEFDDSEIEASDSFTEIDDDYDNPFED